MKLHYPKLYIVPFTYLKNVKFILKEKSSMKSYLRESAFTTECSSKSCLIPFLPDDLEVASSFSLSSHRALF